MKSFEFVPVVKEILSKDYSILSSGCHLVQWSKMVCAFFVDGMVWNISVKLF